MGMQACVPSYREHYWQNRGSSVPSEDHRRGRNRDQNTPLTRESRDRARYTPGREQEIPRGFSRREECEGKGDKPARERGTSRAQE